MTTYERLLDLATKENIDVVETYFESNAKGLFIDNLIAIKSDMPSCEKACILAEELAHHKLTVGNILNQNNIDNRKQETLARKLAITCLLPIENLVSAVKNGCRNIYEIADHLNLSEDFVKEAICVYRAKYGASCKIGNETLVFNDLGFYLK